MLPALPEGQFCVFVEVTAVKDGDIVLAKTPARDIVKRVLSNDKTTLLLGDNVQESSSYVVDEQTSIIGKLIWPKVAKF